MPHKIINMHPICDPAAEILPFNGGTHWPYAFNAAYFQTDELLSMNISTKWACVRRVYTAHICDIFEYFMRIWH